MVLQDAEEDCWRGKHGYEMRVRRWDTNTVGRVQMVRQVRRECPNLGDNPRSGRPKDRELVALVARELENAPYASARHIATLLECSKGTVTRILKTELGLRFFALRWVPHELNEAQKAMRVTKAQELLDALRQSELAYVFTSAESWFSYYNPHPAKWVKTAAAAGERAMPALTKNKTMVIVCWSFIGFSLSQRFPKGGHTTQSTSQQVSSLSLRKRSGRPVQFSVSAERNSTGIMQGPMSRRQQGLSWGPKGSTSFPILHTLQTWLPVTSTSLAQQKHRFGGKDSQAVMKLLLKWRKFLRKSRKMSSFGCTTPG